MDVLGERSRYWSPCHTLQSISYGVMNTSSRNGKLMDCMDASTLSNADHYEQDEVKEDNSEDHHYKMKSIGRIGPDIDNENGKTEGLSHTNSRGDRPTAVRTTPRPDSDDSLATQADPMQPQPPAKTRRTTSHGNEEPAVKADVIPTLGHDDVIVFKKVDN